MLCQILYFYSQIGKIKVIFFIPVFEHFFKDNFSIALKYFYLLEECES
jgi:hypothetical protein